MKSHEIEQCSIMVKGKFTSMPGRCYGTLACCEPVMLEYKYTVSWGIIVI